MGESILTAEAAKLIHRSSFNTSQILQRNGINPIKTLGKYKWPKDEVVALVERKPEFQRPYKSGPGITVNLGEKRNEPASPAERETIVEIARRRIANGVRVGDKENYDLPYPAPGDVDPVGAVILRFIDEGDREYERNEGGDDKG